jgi:hypothetical protein
VLAVFVVVGLGAGVLASSSPADLKQRPAAAISPQRGMSVPAGTAGVRSHASLRSAPIALGTGVPTTAGNHFDGARGVTTTITTKSLTTTVPTTTVPNLPACQPSSFTSSATTDQDTYEQGELVTIAATVTNMGRACVTNEEDALVCIGADVEDASGDLVWTTWAPPTTGCAAGSGPAVVLPRGWAQHASWAWQQDECTSHITNCSGQRVPPGRFQLFGDDWDHLSSPIWITIESPGPVTTTTTS